MAEQEHFIVVDGRMTCRIAGSVSFENAVARVRAAIAFARVNQVQELLVDIRTLAGFAVPDTFQRFWAIVNWAEEAGGRLRLAMVAREEVIDRQKFGVTVASNRGLDCNIFATESEACAWLASRTNEH